MPNDDPDAASADNLSTEHQRDGDARRPQDTLDRDRRAGGTSPETGSKGDDERPDRDTPGGNPQEDVEERPNVSTVTPDDYPQQQ